ncbi:hypothetical protein pEaSNUABM5_00230 [Erwinia phage pEa_SNUABM_5]|uniref:Uncharacterized protein n=1 Tax=Erwinia phage pEa_SNUABM_5 TaxID=2797313 RepID=A0A7T8EQ93_9CAUD|nr:hypothetical protein MPK73_gp230 [Erwinia phage pEa_SNUABM_5]QQO90372.1 hypothetical protein pEaSNUABM5_00230 [Erwinia phage pEa_SNUABM_5]
MAQATKKKLKQRRAKPLPAAIPVRVIEDTRPVNTCPELESDTEPFMFRGQCPITRCQYCTTSSSTGCMALDRREASDRSISHKEIAYYKRGLFPELRDYDQKQLDTIIRQAQTRAKAAVALSSYIAQLDDTDCDKTFTYQPGKNQWIDHVHNYMTQTFSGYRPWMMAYLDDAVRFRAAVKKIADVEIQLGTTLRLTPKKYLGFCAALKKLKQSGDKNV